MHLSHLWLKSQKDTCKKKLNISVEISMCNVKNWWLFRNSNHVVHKYSNKGTFFKIEIYA